MTEVNSKLFAVLRTRLKNALSETGPLYMEVVRRRMFQYETGSMSRREDKLWVVCLTLLTRGWFSDTRQLVLTIQHSGRSFVSIALAYFVICIQSQRVRRCSDRGCAVETVWCERTGTGRNLEFAVRLCVWCWHWVQYDLLYCVLWDSEISVVTEKRLHLQGLLPVDHSV
jgi:hypothetical protein